jgi:hypothetical protein
MRGTIDFRHDAEHDVVIASPRWSLASAPDVVRWYEMNARYFKGRFASPKDLVFVNDRFDIAPGLGTLWACYALKLQDSWVRHVVHVHSNAQVREVTRTSVLRFCLSSWEAATVDDAIAAIARLRDAALHAPTSGFLRALVPGAAVAPPPQMEVKLVR